MRAQDEDEAVRRCVENCTKTKIKEQDLNVTVVFTVYVYHTGCDGSNKDTKTCQD